MSNTTTTTPEQTRTATETTINLCGTEFIIRQPSAGKTATKWGAKRYQHIVTIKANDTSKRFSFYGSEADYENNKNRLTEEDLLYVLESAVADAIAGTYECKDFFAEFGYSDDPCEGIKAYKGCKDTLRRLDDMGITEDELYDIETELNEMED